MTDQRVAALSRNLRMQGYVDNDPDATLAAMRLLVLADALEAQPGWVVEPGSNERLERR